MTHTELLALKAAGNCWVEDDYGNRMWWPFCVIDGCSNRSCLRLYSPKCYPHTLPGVPIVADIEEEETVTC